MTQQDVPSDGPGRFVGVAMVVTALLVGVAVTVTGRPTSAGEPFTSFELVAEATMDELADDIADAAGRHGLHVDTTYGASKLDGAAAQESGIRLSARVCEGAFSTDRLDMAAGSTFDQDGRQVVVMAGFGDADAIGGVFGDLARDFERCRGGRELAPGEAYSSPQHVVVHTKGERQLSFTNVMTSRGVDQRTVMHMRASGPVVVQALVLDRNDLSDDAAAALVGRVDALVVDVLDTVEAHGLAAR